MSICGEIYCSRVSATHGMRHALAGHALSLQHTPMRSTPTRATRCLMPPDRRSHEGIREHRPDDGFGDAKMHGCVFVTKFGAYQFSVADETVTDQRCEGCVEEDADDQIGDGDLGGDEGESHHGTIHPVVCHAESWIGHDVDASRGQNKRMGSPRVTHQSIEGTMMTRVVFQMIRQRWI